MHVCCESDPKCYNPRVLKSLCHEKRHRTETAKQFFRSAAATRFSSRMTALKHVNSASHDTGQHGDLPCNGDHDNRRQQQQQQQQQQE